MLAWTPGLNRSSAPISLPKPNILVAVGLSVVCIVDRRCVARGRHIRPICVGAVKMLCSWAVDNSASFWPCDCGRARVRINIRVRVVYKKPYRRAPSASREQRYLAYKGKG